MNNKDVANIVVREGLDYAIRDYIDFEDIDDSRLSILWEEAQEILDKIIEFLEEETGLILY